MIGRWLKTNWFVVGVAGMIVDLLARAYHGFGSDWVASRIYEQDRYVGQDLALRLGYAVAAMDVVATVLWWIFLLALGSRILGELKR